MKKYIPVVCLAVFTVFILMMMPMMKILIIWTEGIL